MTQKQQGAAAPSVVRENGGHARPWLRNSLSVFAVCALGTVGFYVAFIAGFWKPTTENPENATHDSVPAQILGYLSAVRLSITFVFYHCTPANLNSCCTLGKFRMDTDT